MRMLRIALGTGLILVAFPIWLVTSVLIVVLAALGTAVEWAFEDG